MDDLGPLLKVTEAIKVKCSVKELLQKRHHEHQICTNDDPEHAQSPGERSMTLSFIFKVKEFGKV